MPNRSTVRAGRIAACMIVLSFGLLLSIPSASAATSEVMARPGQMGVVPSNSTCVLPVAHGPTSCTQAATLWFNSKAYGYGSGTQFVATTPVGQQVRSLAISNLAGYTFLGRGAGKGQAVKNNAAAGSNNNGNPIYVNVWYNSGFKGARDGIRPATTRNLAATKNDDASLNVLYRT